jgi:SAM-dependent methyltransferase
MLRPDLHEANRLSWNAATVAHNRHKPDQAGFLRAGGSTLFPEEVALLGDVRGKDVLHLLCNSGQDTLGIAALGAAVTGVDISDEAIAFARQLSGESGIAGRFERSDVYPWLEQAAKDGRTFDTVFCSYGALCWLSDLDAYFRGVAGLLKSGGRFVCMEFHPFAMIFDDHAEPKYDYRMPEPLSWDDGIRDYVAESCGGLTPSGPVAAAEPFHNPHPCHEFQRGLGDILGAVIGAGLLVREFREYEYTNGWKPYAGMKELPGRRWAMPEGKPSVPLMYGVVAEKP